VRVGTLAARGVRVRAGDFTDAATLDHAFEGAEQVLVVSPAIRGGDASAASRAAIDAAARVLYTSHQAASPDSLFAAQAQHAATESHLVEKGVRFAALRHGFYASTLEIYVPDALKTGELRLPEDGPVSWTAHDDLAEADAIALTSPGVFDGITPALTASEALDFADVARLVGELTGRTVKRIVVDDEEWSAGVVAGGLPAPVAEFALGMFRAARRGEFAVTDPTLATVLGRPPVLARDVLEAMLR